MAAHATQTRPYCCAVSVCSSLLTPGDRAHLVVPKAMALNPQALQSSEKLEWRNALQAGDG